MQTFLPYESFVQSAECLDNKRLGKQRVEVLQILNAITFGQSRWHNHPAVNMWRGFEAILVTYGCGICIEWISRGFKDTCFGKIRKFYKYFSKTTCPWWLGNEDFHRSHRSNLFRKDKAHYSKYFKHDKGLTDDLPYLWPLPNGTFRTIKTK